SWLADEDRLDQAGVPAAERRPLTKPQIALELLDRVRGEGLPGWAVVTDAGYGASADFRAGVARRGLVYMAARRRGLVGLPGPADRGPAPRVGTRAPRDAASPGRRQPAAGSPERTGPAAAAAQGDLARGHQGQAVGTLRLAARLAGSWLARGRVCR